MKPDRLRLRVRDVVLAINMPVCEWEGRCGTVSRLVLESGLVEGTLVLGHWVGEIAPTSIYKAAIPMGLVPHAWIDLPDGRICDPTRFVFLDRRASIFVGSDQEYDRAGEHWRAGIPSEPPAVDVQRPLFTIAGDRFTQQFCWVLCGQPAIMTDQHARWLAGLPLEYLGLYVRHLYRAVEEHGWRDAIPASSWEQVMGPKVRREVRNQIQRFCHRICDARQALRIQQEHVSR